MPHSNSDDRIIKRHELVQYKKFGRWIISLVIILKFGIRQPGFHIPKSIELLDLWPPKFPSTMSFRIKILSDLDGNQAWNASRLTNHLLLLTTCLYILDPQLSDILRQNPFFGDIHLASIEVPEGSIIESKHHEAEAINKHSYLTSGMQTLAEMRAETAEPCFDQPGW